MSDGLLARRFGVYDIEREVDLDEFLAIWRVWHGFTGYIQDFDGEYGVEVR